MVFENLIETYLLNPSFESYTKYLLVAIANGFIGLTWMFLVKARGDKKWMDLQIFDKIGLSLVVGLFSFLSSFISIGIAIFIAGALSVFISPDAQLGFDANYFAVLITLLMFIYPFFVTRKIFDANEGFNHIEVIFKWKTIISFGLIMAPLIMLSLITQISGLGTPVYTLISVVGSIISLVLLLSK